MTIRFPVVLPENESNYAEWEDKDALVKSWCINSTTEDLMSQPDVSVAQVKEVWDAVILRKNVIILHRCFSANWKTKLPLFSAYFYYFTVSFSIFLLTFLVISFFGSSGC